MMSRSTSMLLFLVVSITLVPHVDAVLPNPKIIDLLESFETMKSTTTADSQIVKILDMILQLLKADGLAWESFLPPKTDGVHPCNRYGFGISAANAHRLGARIHAMGWSWAACSMAICMTASASNKIVEFTRKMQAGSPKFGKSTENEIRYGSLACGQTNQFLVAAIDGAETSENTIAADGRISRELLEKNDANIASAMDKGMRWTILHEDTEKLYGNKLPMLVQKARQAIGQVQNEESIFQIALQVQELAASEEASGGKPDFSIIEEIVLQSQPKCAEDLAHICAWVQLYGGGKGGKYVKEINDYIALSVPSNRDLDGKWLSAFNKLAKQLERTELCPDFVAASVKAHLGGPQKKVLGGITRFIKESSIAALAGTKKADMLEANEHIKSFKKGN